ncbi:hypothetical protein TraAM80_01561 [Trypanosoma rangeli]|uniref:Uncharacterized protein n=1 Tax=Trypanosoma rangeli TaxID=5698 RepID=A0A3R7LAH0_TRYRA|nr:uncharacterized protein TraAM80_01561 [Trypanosoma rangeli]RNF10390.1 hypothetical protein TraAM80_01561 [Trypanosoma rangeli]|eukprot:RNF10390.1 hypothetical protein TraAM80_01561 [Trypanosoma rangeli]
MRFTHSRKRKRLAASAAALALATATATPALQRNSRQIEDFTQQLMDAMTHASGTTVGVLQPSTSSSEGREDEERNTPGRDKFPVAATVVKDDAAINATATPPQRRLQSRTMSRHSAECSPCSRVTRSTSTTRGGLQGHGSPLRASSVQAACTPHSGDHIWPGDVSRTEAEVLQQHGQLSQFNSLYAVQEGSGACSSCSSSSSGRDSAVVDRITEGGKAEAGEAEEERRVRRRRRELSEISPVSLALYTRLAECGVDAMDRPFATCVVRRARGLLEAWATGFL